jgi:hypothetical protein
MALAFAAFLGAMIRNPGVALGPAPHAEQE